MLKKINMDLYILIPILILNLIGSMILYSASGSLDLVFSQNIKFCLGFLLMVFISMIDSNKVAATFSKSSYFFVLFLLVMVFLFGETIMGAKRWINLFVFNFQPSELMKLALPMMLSYLIFKNGIPKSIGSLFYYFLIISIPTVFILLQPDLGTSILVVLSGIYVLFLSGMRWIHISVIAAFVFAMFPLLWGFIKDYQRERILTMFNPESDPLGSGYHTIQSKIAIGNGGITGKGFTEGTQTQLGFIPEQHTDFIISAFLEEMGFLGFIILMSLYLLIVLRIFYLSGKIEDIYGRLLTGSITMIFVSYIFVNIGMVSGILPVVGVPLPFFSYGGTFTITQMVSFGLVFCFLNDVGYKTDKKYKL